MKDFQPPRGRRKTFKSITESEEGGSMLVFLRSIIFLISVLICLATVGNLIFLQNLDANPANLQIEGNSIIPSSIFLEDLSLSRKHNWEVDGFEASVKLAKHPWVEQVFFKHVYPDKFSLKIKERKPVSFYRIPGHIYLLTEDFYILPAIYNDDGWDLPVITDLSIKGELSPGELASYPSLASAVKLINFLKENNFLTLDMISEVDISDTFNIKLIGMIGEKTILLGYEDFPSKLRNMFYAMPEIQKLKKVNVIDLRYKNKVIVK